MKNQIRNTNEEIFSILLLISLVNLLLYFLSVSFINYGISGDELYYIACTNHLDFGYVDNPPLSIWILALWKFLFGDSLFVIRILPAIVSSATVFMIGLFTVRLGGGKNSVIIATVTFMLTPVFLSASTIYSMDVFDFFFWILSAYIYLGIIQSENRQLWYTLGVAIGLGLLNKTSMLWLSAGILTGTVLTPMREDLRTKYPYIAAGIALLIFSPYIIWNLVHDFAHIEFIKSAASGRYGGLSPVSFVFDLFLNLNPVSVIVWLPGVLFYFFEKNARQYRALGYIWLVALSVLFIEWHSKGGYIAPSFQVLFAGGAIMIMKWNARLKRLKYALVIPVVVLGILLAPLAHPFLPIDKFTVYQSLLGVKTSGGENRGLDRLSKFCANMFGWNDLARKVSEVYLSIPEEIRKNSVVYCRNSGEAGAIEYYKSKYKLPDVVCPHNSYWYWWNEKRNPDTVIIIGGTLEDHLKSFNSVEVASYYKTKYAVPYENNFMIFIGRGLKRSPKEIKQRNKLLI